MMELVDGFDVRKHLRYHFLRKHIMGSVFLVYSEVKDLKKKKKEWCGAICYR
jgi:hypothetical protein